MNSPRNIDGRQRSRRITSEEKLKEYILSKLGSPLIDIEVTQEQIELCIDDTIRIFSEWAYSAQSKVGIILKADPSISEYMMDERVSAILGISLGGSLGTVAGQGSAGGGISLGAFGTIGQGYVPHITLQGEVSTLESGGIEASSPSGGTAGGVGSSSSTTSSGITAMADAFVGLAVQEGMRTLFDRSVNWSFSADTGILKLFEKVSGNILVECELEYIPNRDYDEIYSEPWIKEYATALTKRQWGENIAKFDSALVGGSTLNYDRIISEAQQEIDRLNEELLTKWSGALGIYSA